jgi:hypothetical protein
VSGQSLLPLVDPSFGPYDRAIAPLTAVFGTLSVRPSTPGLEHLRYFRYPNGEEHVYDVVADPGETVNLAGGPDTPLLRAELVQAALHLGLDLRGAEDPARGVNALMAMDGSVVLEGGPGDTDYWAYGEAAERIVERPDGGHDTLWYLSGPDGFTLRLPANIESIRMATVVSRHESDPSQGKVQRIVAHPDSAITFEGSERVSVHVTGSRGDDVMLGPVYAGAIFEGGEGHDRLIAQSSRRNDAHGFYGGPGDDTLEGGAGRDTLDGGPGDDVIRAGDGFAQIFGGTGNDSITAGDRTVTIHTGPGRNTVVSGAGRDRIHVGPGENTVTAGGGGVTLTIDWGGVCTLTDWTPEDRIVLTGWPAPPTLLADGPDMLITLGLSVVEVKGCRDAARLRAACVFPGEEAP